MIFMSRQESPEQTGQSGEDCTEQTGLRSRQDRYDPTGQSEAEKIFKSRQARQTINSNSLLFSYLLIIIQ